MADNTATLPVEETHTENVEESTEETTDSTTTQYTFPTVYLLRSKTTLPRIAEILKKFGCDFAELRIMYDKFGKETSDGNLVLLDTSAYNKLVESGFGEDQDRQSRKEFKIKPFVIDKRKFPHEYQSDVLFVPVPKALDATDETVKQEIHARLTTLSNWDVLPSKSWNLTVPLDSRETGGVRSGCFITFNETVTLPQKAVTRILLNDTYWATPVRTNRALPNGQLVSREERLTFHCYYAHKQKPRTERPASAAPRGTRTTGTVQQRVTPPSADAVAAAAAAARVNNVRQFFKTAQPKPRASRS